jgi:hypothetical protein
MSTKNEGFGFTELLKRPELLVGVVDATVLEDFGRICMIYLLICFYLGASFLTFALKKED